MSAAARRDAETIFLHAVSAVQPRHFVPLHLPSPPPGDGRIFLLAAGKAAAAMAFEAERILGERLNRGFAVSSHLPDVPLQKTGLIVAGHPVPDINSLIAGTTMLQLAAGLNPEDHVVFLLSGGASALLADVPPGASMEELQHAFQLLLNSGADIAEMNTVRKHLSAIKGGQLARAIHPASVHSIILSDVPGNDPAVIGSGPTVADHTTFADALAIIDKYQLRDRVAAGILAHLEQGEAGLIPETARPGELPNATHVLAASNRIALEAAAQQADELGYHAHILTDHATGKARDLAAELVKAALSYKGPFPACLLAGGESTVQVTGNGLGGRNQELALAAGLLIKDHPRITFLSAGTDGIDGPTDAAGAVIDAETLAQGPDPLPFLENNDSWHYFHQTHTHIRTGPTNTNVMDLAVILVQGIAND
ncbi:glycerate kinase type-2 family protein [Chitinophaga rhizosphaerae]|uniref:glycerate kinase type-2 family protein n=1 Tax=Chitinophaga rhizosphaerae TaxID=1864947 RepID=UPI000F80986F|nr:DUF4147 domain-containing protein [Chitinophaga rhizosphaerae]